MISAKPLLAAGASGGGFRQPGEHEQHYQRDVGLHAPSARGVTAVHCLCIWGKSIKITRMKTLRRFGTLNDWTPVRIYIWKYERQGQFTRIP
jgi:hypothetical protein